MNDDEKMALIYSACGLIEDAQKKIARSRRGTYRSFYLRHRARSGRSMEQEG